MGVKHHLLRLARIGPNKRHPAVAEADMRHLDGRGRAIDQDNFLAPVEPIRLTGTKLSGTQASADAARVAFDQLAA